MEIIEAVFLGLIQGVSEFLPISSSGHLVLIPWLFKIDDPGLAFDVMLHLATLLAIVAYFFRDWLKMIRAVFIKGGAEEQKNRRLLRWIIIGTIPASIIGLFLEKYAEEALRHPLLIAFNLAFFGVILVLADKLIKKGQNTDSLNNKKSFLIGIGQAIAIIPGVSRSGITITAGRLASLSRAKAARFSFLLSTPAIVGAGILKLPDLFAQAGINAAAIGGFVAAFISGILSIKYLMKYLVKRGFLPFLIYRLLVALIIVIIYYYKA